MPCWSVCQKKKNPSSQKLEMYLGVSFFENAVVMLFCFLCRKIDKRHDISTKLSHCDYIFGSLTD